MKRALKTKRWGLAIAGAVGAAVIGSQFVMAQTSTTTSTLNPFSPTLTPATTTTAVTTGTLVTLSTKAAVRTPPRPSARSPFRP